MKKFLSKVISWVVIIIAFFFLILFPLGPELVEGRKKIYLEDYDKKLDLLILGSSRAEHGIRPDAFDTCKYNVFNIGEDGHGLPSNYLMLKVLLQRYNLKVDRVLLSIDELALNGTRSFSSKFRDDFFVSDLDDQEVYEAFRGYRSASYAFILKHFPQISNLIYSDFDKLLKRYPYAFRSCSKMITNKFKKSILLSARQKGYKGLPNKYHDDDKMSNKAYVIEQDDLNYFNKIITLCKEHHIDIYLVRMPILHCSSYNSIAFDSFITEFSERNNIKFYDYKCDYQIRSGYYDNVHPADSISTVISHRIAKEMKMIY